MSVAQLYLLIFSGAVLLVSGFITWLVVALNGVYGDSDLWEMWPLGLAITLSAGGIAAAIWGG